MLVRTSLSRPQGPINENVRSMSRTERKSLEHEATKDFSDSEEGENARLVMPITELARKDIEDSFESQVNQASG